MTELSLEDKLCIALRSDDLHSIKSLLDSGVDANLVSSENGLPCFRNARSFHATKLLLSNGANIDQLDVYGETWLMSAVRGFPELVEVLLQHGANPDTVSPINRETALFYPAGSKKTKSIELLFLAGANLDWQRLDGWTRLHVASIAWEHDVVEVLCTLGANTNLYDFEGNSPLHFATMSYRPAEGTRSVDALLSAGANPNSTGRSDGYCPIHVAAYWNMSELIRHLAFHGASTERRAANGDTVLDVAISRDAFESAELLQVLNVKK